MQTNRRQLAAWAGLIAWSGLLVMIAYGTALRLPYMADDYFHIPYVDTHSLTQMWQSAEGLYYFRPLSFTLWKLMHVILGHHDPVAQHMLNLLLHIGNGLMVAWLAGHLWSSPGRGDPTKRWGLSRSRVDWYRRYASAALFLLYPFSYEAVPWIGALVHPLVTTLVLLSVVTYLKLRATNHRAWGLLAFVFAFLSPFAHETGALVGPLIAVVELTRPLPAESVWRRVRRAALWVVPTLLWFSIWQSVPTPASGETLALNPARNLLRNSLYFAQAAAYPLTWLGGWLQARFGIDTLVVAAGLSVLALSGAALVQRRSGAPAGSGAKPALRSPRPEGVGSEAEGSQDRRAWLPWLWIGVAALPAVFFLPFSYVSAAPRVLMLASVGVALLWTDVLLRLAEWGGTVLTHRRFSTALAAGLCSALLIQNYGFIRDRMQIYEIGGSVIRQVVAATVAANEAGQAAIFINLPAWIAPPRAAFAIGQAGIVFGPASDQLETMVSVHTGHPASLQAIKFDAIRQEVPYHVGLIGSGSDLGSLAKSSGQVFVTRYTPDAALIQAVGALAVAAPPVQPVALFETFATLLDARASLGQTRLRVDLTWQVQEPPPPDVTLFVHVLDASGQLTAQVDGDPLAGSYPFWQWPPGSIAQDRRSIEVSGSGLSLRVGLYNRSTGERLTATSATGAVWADNAVPIPIQLQSNLAP